MGLNDFLDQLKEQAIYMEADDDKKKKKDDKKEEDKKEDTPPPAGMVEILFNLIQMIMQMMLLKI